MFFLPIQLLDWGEVSPTISKSSSDAPPILCSRATINVRWAPMKHPSRNTHSAQRHYRQQSTHRGHSHRGGGFPNRASASSSVRYRFLALFFSSLAVLLILFLFRIIFGSRIKSYVYAALRMNTIPMQFAFVNLRLGAN